MTFLNSTLVMVGLAVQDDDLVKPNAAQPSLADGIHLRWAFDKGEGFPWYGYYLFRRQHNVADAQVIHNSLVGASPGHTTSGTWQTTQGTFSSNIPLSFTDDYPPGTPDGVVELDLSARDYLRFSLNNANLAFWVELKIFFRTDGLIPVRALRKGVPVQVTMLKGLAGNLESIELQADAIDAVEIGSGAALLVDIGFLRVADNIASGWQKIPGLSYPLALPLLHPDYPPSAGTSEDLAAARQAVSSRVKYGDPTSAFPAPVPLHSQGSLQIISGSEIVKGQATGWHEGLVGGLLQIPGDTTAYMILSVLSPEKLVLSRPYGGATGNGITYMIYRDPFGQLHDALVHLVRGGPSSRKMVDRFLPASVASQGTVGVSSGGNIVQGTGTMWTAELSGLYLRLAGNPLAYRIVSADPAAQRLTIDPMYVGTTVSGVNYSILALLGSPDAEGSAPHLAEQSPLEMMQVASLHPAVAQVLGLYVVDTHVSSGIAYDYLVVSAGKQLVVGQPTADPGQDALDWINRNGLEDQDINAAVVFKRQIGRAAALDTPSGLAVYALPGAGYNEAGAAGLIWDVGQTEDQKLLLPGKPVMYHIWRSDLGSQEPSSTPTAYTLLTRDSPVLILHTDPPGQEPQKRKDWPRFRLYYIDGGLAEGWYSYRLTGIDLFGRYSLDSNAAPWQEWTPAPDPKPWYWGRATSPMVHPFAVGVLDKTPPPAPTGVEAFALDPADPFLVRDAAYLAWQNALTASTWYQNLSEQDKKTLIGLRVRWLWTEGQQTLAPDTAEFRLYFQPGAWNAVFGRIAAVMLVANQPGQSQVETNITNTRSADAYMGASLRIGMDAFRIISSSGPGAPLVLTVESGPVITAGQASVTEGSQLVNGKNTNWQLSHTGLSLRLAGENHVYHVLKIDVATQTLTLDAGYRGATGDKNYTLGGKLPRAGMPCSVVISADSINTRRTDYYDSPVWEQRIAAVGYNDHTSQTLIPVRDSNGIMLRGQAATASGIEVTLQDLPEEADLLSLDPEGKLNTLLIKLDAAGSTDLYPVVSIDPDPKKKTVVLKTAPTLTSSSSAWMFCFQARSYEVFLPDPTHVQPAGIVLPVTQGEPIGYGSIGVTAVDDKTHTPDSRQSAPWGGRTGNEGQVSAPATIFRVLRERPDAPEIPAFDSDRLFATRADYHSQSYYTVRWKPVQGLRTHIFRALDEALYNTDWLIRSTRLNLDPNNPRHVDCFPTTMLAVHRQAAAQQLNALASPNSYSGLSANGKEILARLPGNAGVRTSSELFDRDWEIRRTRQGLVQGDSYLPAEWTPNPDSSAMQAKRQDVINRLQAIASPADYFNLTDDARRVLAGLPGNEAAFMQITVESLDADETDAHDPAHLRWANRLGPDNMIGFMVDPALRAYLDHVDGRASNAFFYRAAAVDGANNTSPLSLSTPPVYCPDFRAPGKPQVLKAIGGERQVRLLWEAGPGLAPLRYRVFRVTDREQGRDIRQMGDPVCSFPAQPLVVAGRSIDISAIHGITQAERVYEAKRFDPRFDLLTGQTSAQYLPAPGTVTGNQITGITAPNGTAVVLVYRDLNQTLQYTPSGSGEVVWTDSGLIGARNYFYRVIAIREGQTVDGTVTIASDSSALSAARAYDLTPPTPPTVTLIEWVRVDQAGNIFPYSQPVPAGQLRFPAVHLIWSSSDPLLRCLVQFRSDAADNFENASGWLLPGVYETIHRNDWTYVDLEYRLKVINQAGNANVTFSPATLAVPT